MFLRDTTDAQRDLERNFSCNVNSWCPTEEEAVAWQERNDALMPPKQDPHTKKWCADPERGLSGFHFIDGDSPSFNHALNNVYRYALTKDRIAVFKASDYHLGAGLDGEDVFSNAEFVSWLKDFKRF